MSLFSYVRSIYAIDTLDTRFTNSSRTPYRSSNNDQIDPAKTSAVRDGVSQNTPILLNAHGRPLAQPSKWGTLEFYFYYLVFLITVPYMFWIAYDVSRPSDPHYLKYEYLLSPGWVPGRKIDVSDAQYRTFRENVPYVALLLPLHPILRRLYDRIRPIPSTSRISFSKANGNTRPASMTGDTRLEQRVSFDFGFALIFLIALHGFSAMKIILILCINYSIATKLPKRYVPAVTWTFNICTLFANELCEGYRYARVEESLLSFVGLKIAIPTVDHATWGQWLDTHSGIMPRWEVLFNITVLRLISYNMDYYWSLDRRAGSPVEKKQLDPAHLSEQDRVSLPAAVNDYCFRNFFAYTVYAPLYLAGPIITFNDYISQSKYQPASIETSRTLKYGVRFLLTLLCMELVLHFDYAVAISKADPNWSDYTPAQLSLLSYFNLHVIWLKLLLPWRLFRLWSLIDGIDPPENMVRCISNNPSPLKFWRGWHRSYNRWLVRYIFIPMGGSKNRGKFGLAKSGLNYIMIFTFVALWHDIKLNLLIWGWLIVLFMLPEVIAGYLFTRKNWENHPTIYRHLRAVGVVGNVMMMMTANLVGFAVGVDGMKAIINGIFQDFSGLAFLVIACCALFVGIQVMFEIREEELRNGINLKC